MSIEDNEAAVMRGFLATAFGTAEPPLRDLASGSIARGDDARRRVRWYTAGGAVLSAAAVAGTLALAGGTGTTVKPTPVSTGPAVGKQSPTTQPVDPSAKVKDIAMRLPGLLQPLLPAGITIQVAPSTYTQMNDNDFLLTGPTGTTQIAPTGGKVDWSASDDRKMGCLQKGGCEVHPIAGGTVYVNASSTTAAEQTANLPHGSLQPGTENTVVQREAWLMFIPADRSKQYLQIREATTVAQVQFAAKAPAGWTSGSWPPALVPPGMKQASDPRGLAISADAFAAMATAPGIADVETLLDPDTPAAPAAVTAVADLDAQIGRLLAPLLPPGVTVGAAADLRTAAPGSVLLTGASGQNNMLHMATMKQDAGLQGLKDGCPDASVQCDHRKVPGGQIAVWIQKPTDSNLHPTADKPNTFQYFFIPDDTSKPAVTFDLTTNWMSQTIADPLITTDQFATATANPHLAAIVEQVTALAAQR